MTKPWQTSAWKKKRAEFLKDKSCEWCGSTKSRHEANQSHFRAALNRRMRSAPVPSWV